MSKKGKLKKGKLKKEIKKIIKETYLKESLNESYYCNGAGQNASSHPGCRIHGEPCINWDENTGELIKEMRVRDLKEISKVVIKEDFYAFINAGQNVLRTMEGKGMDNGKKYLEYLVKHNIM